MATVLPWRRSQVVAGDVLGPLLSDYRAKRPKADTALITRAYTVADQAHEGQFRKSGEPYITHPLAVAVILARMGLDDTTLAAALLHDAVEDTSVTLKDLETGFGIQVAQIVDGVTKLDRVKFASKEAQQAATVRKMLIAMAKDGRVLLIKLADRLHNMRTIAAMDVSKQERTARETLDIYAPLAHRLGIQDLRWQLEDLSFAALHPRRYAEIDQMVSTRAPEREIYLAQVVGQVQEGLENLKIQGEVTGRPKHYWSIYDKMVVKGREFDDIFDLVGIRVVVDRESDCYAALGCIHGSFAPVQGRIKDYISMPKFNLYRSLHTTVMGPGGKPLEVQIRTKEMHRWAEFGIAAHWDYKEARGRERNGDSRHRGSGRPTGAQVAWMSRIGDMDNGAEDPAEFLESLKLDLEHDEVYVFTPAGDVHTLPNGATPVDFAYAIHTDVGHRCIGARINGRLMPLDTALVSGDTIEVVTAKVPTAAPSRDWLRFVVTARARNKIRQWFSRERRDVAIENGREELVKALRKAGLPVQKLQSSAEILRLALAMNHADLESLHVAIGEGHVSAASVVQRLERDLRGPEAEVQLPSTARQARRPGLGSQVGVHVEGMDDLLVRLSRCCTPVPTDEIIGFVTRGRGVSVHRSDCRNASALVNDEGRIVEVEWDDQRQGTFVASIEVKALDRSRLLTEVTRVLSEHHVNIIGSSSHTGSDRVSKMRFEFELADPAHLEHVMSALRRIDSVYDAYRLLPGKGDSIRS